MRALGVSLLAVIACGGQLANGDGGPDAAGGDVASDAGSNISYDACSGSDGIKLCGSACGGINDCPVPGVCALPKTILAVCIDSQEGRTYGPCAGGNSTVFAKDGTLCVPGQISNPDAAPSGQFAMDYLDSADIGYAIMYAKNGYGSFCHYADRATYDGTPVPDAPASCPTSTGFQLCGGACGDCPSGEYCTGRSPLHPYSLCFTDYSKAFEPQTDACVRDAPNAGGCMGNAQNPPSACLTFKVSAADQPFADQNGICTEKSICLAAAAGYPGGAYCTP